MVTVEIIGLAGGGYVHVRSVNWSPAHDWATESGLYVEDDGIFDDDEQVAGLALFGAGAGAIGEKFEVNTGELVWLGWSGYSPSIYRRVVETG